MPAKKRETAKSTTASMKLSARSDESRSLLVDSSLGDVVQRVASVVSATWYSGIDEGGAGRVRVRERVGREPRVERGRELGPEALAIEVGERRVALLRSRSPTG